MVKPLERDQVNTSIASWSFALAAALRDYGHDADRVFADAGINLSAVRSPAERLAVNQVQQVWHFAALHCDDDFGFAVARHLNVTSFHALGAALYYSESILSLLQRLVRYRCVISHSFLADLIEQREQFTLVVVDQRSIQSVITHEALFAMLATMVNTLQPERSTLCAVQLKSGAGARRDQIEAFFRCPVQFDADQSSISFNRACAQSTLRNGNSELATAQDQLVEQYIAANGLISEYMLRVKDAIHQQLSSGEIGIERVAARLHVTVRTLQRRLAAENSSYHALVDQVRANNALALAQQPQLTTLELALQLGFQDAGSFRRNFKRWTGTTVTGYRQQLASGR